MAKVTWYGRNARIVMLMFHCRAHPPKEIPNSFIHPLLLIYSDIKLGFNRRGTQFHRY